MGRSTPRFWSCLGAAVAAVLFSVAAAAAAFPDLPAPELLAEVFPGADGAGPMAGNPPAAPVTAGGQPAGYLLSTLAVAGSVGLSGKPFDVVVGLDLHARITGTRLVGHHEPILILGIDDRRLRAFVQGHRGIDLHRPDGAMTSASAAGPGLPDTISGATVSSLLLRQAILAAARAVARSRGLLAPAGGEAAGVDLDSFEPLDWPALLAGGAVARLRVTGAELTAQLAAEGGEYRVPVGPETLFIDLYTALATPAAIGRNLLGDRAFGQWLPGGGDGAQAVLIAANGLYSFKGTSFNRTGLFERVQVVQGEQVFTLTAAGHRRLDQLAPGVPEFREAGLFLLPAGSGFDPAEPWRLSLLVEGVRPDGGAAFAAFSLPYHLPERLIRRPPAAATVSGLDWRREWSGHPVTVALTGAALLALTGILMVQDAVSRRPALHRRLRFGFLVFTAVWFGWCTQGQLSITNLITLAQMMRNGFHWEFFLLLPVIFLLWSFVAVALLFWGRGVFCGWLCPFGAVQELLYALARRLGLLVLKVPAGLHERLWALKYLLFMIIIGLSLEFTDLAIVLAEVEPFKTVTNLHFARNWPFVLYVGALLGAGLFVERFYCRYLCVLGAGLAIPAQLRVFDWLKRRYQCGAECRVCANRCPVGAVRGDGRINVNECVYCLKCQLHYFDPAVCPPLARQRKRTS